MLHVWPNVLFNLNYHLNSPHASQIAWMVKIEIIKHRDNSHKSLLSDLYKVGLFIIQYPPN